MHYIAEDLDMDSWVKAGLARLGRYLACWGLFIELYPADAPLSGEVQLGRLIRVGRLAFHGRIAEQRDLQVAAKTGLVEAHRLGSCAEQQERRFHGFLLPV
jgi:hypothetical protein